MVTPGDRILCATMCDKFFSSAVKAPEWLLMCYFVYCWLVARLWEMAQCNQIGIWITAGWKSPPHMQFIKALEVTCHPSQSPARGYVWISETLFWLFTSNASTWSPKPHVFSFEYQLSCRFVLKEKKCYTGGERCTSKIGAKTVSAHCSTPTGSFIYWSKVKYVSSWESFVVESQKCVGYKKTCAQLA